MERFYPTSIGREYAAQTAMGKVLKFTRGKFGNGIRTNQNISALTELINPLGDLPISKKSVKGSTITVTTQFSNMVDGNLLSTFNLSEVGLFGKLINADGTDIPEYPEALLGYAFDNPGDKIPAILTEFILNFPLTVSDVENVTVGVSSIAYTTQKDFDKHKTAEVLDHPDGSVTRAKLSENVKSELNGLRTDLIKETEVRDNENYYPEYTSDEIDENTKFYIDIANMGDGEGIYKRRQRETDNTSWKDLVSGHELNLSSENYQEDGIISNGTPLTMQLDDYLCFNKADVFAIAFSAKVSKTTETNDLITIGGTRKLVIQQHGAHGIRLITFDDTNVMHVYPSEGYITPNSYDEYHHYVVARSPSTNTIRWYQDGGVINAATSAFTNNNNFIKVDGGQTIKLLDGESCNVGVQYVKILDIYLAPAKARNLYNTHSAINYTNDKTRYDNKFRELDKPEYDEAETRTNLTSGEKLSTALGKIKKWFGDLKAVAFSNDYNDLDNKPESMKNPNSLSLNLNGSSASYNGASSLSRSWYAPVSVGTYGYSLVSGGTGAPRWQGPLYAECTTEGDNVAKAISIPEFKLVKGIRVLVKFTYAHTSSTAATLNIYSTGAKPIVVHTETSNKNVTSSFTWIAGETVEFVYDGTNWVAISSDMGFIGTNIRRNPVAADGDIIPTHLTVGSRAVHEHIGRNSFTSGSYNVASDSNTVAIGGYSNTASGMYSAVVGSDCSRTNGHCSAVVGGSSNTANDMYSVVIGGYSNTASGMYSVVIGGFECLALAHQVKTGHYSNDGTGGNETGTTGDAFIIGNGTQAAKSNAFRVTYAGGVYGKAAYNSTGADYAEMFEWEDGNPNNEDRRGLFAYIVDDKMRLATADDIDKHRIGIISARPAVVGDNYDDDWHGKYLTDEFGAVRTQVVHHEAKYEEVSAFDPETGDAKTERICIREECEAVEPILNPDYDAEQEYIPRAERPEYDFWSFIGKLVVVDDGTCEAGGYCYPSINGIATACNNYDRGFYVMKRLDDTHIKVLIK
ncbi:MAG: hypothetical protein HFE49_00680 [Clostridia bacterium]|nr:hypothetical protein [Clostridia bacterium]